MFYSLPKLPPFNCSFLSILSVSVSQLLSCLFFFPWLLLHELHSKGVLVRGDHWLNLYLHLCFAVRFMSANHGIIMHKLLLIVTDVWQPVQVGFHFHSLYHRAFPFRTLLILHFNENFPIDWFFYIYKFAFFITDSNAVFTDGAGSLDNSKKRGVFKKWLSNPVRKLSQSKVDKTFQSTAATTTASNTKVSLVSTTTSASSNNSLPTLTATTVATAAPVTPVAPPQPAPAPPVHTSEATEDCDIAEIFDIPPMKIVELSKLSELSKHSYQSIMSTSNDSPKDSDKVSASRSLITITKLNVLLYLIGRWFNSQSYFRWKRCHHYRHDNKFSWRWSDARWNSDRRAKRTRASHC